jgi:hypothetical protein
MCFKYDKEKEYNIMDFKQFYFLIRTPSYT